MNEQEFQELKKKAFDEREEAFNFLLKAFAGKEKEYRSRINELNHLIAGYAPAVEFNPIGAVNYFANSVKGEPAAKIGDVEVANYKGDLIYLFGIHTIDSSAIRFMAELDFIREKTNETLLVTSPDNDRITRMYPVNHEGTVMAVRFGGLEGDWDQAELVSWDKLSDYAREEAYSLHHLYREYGRVND